MAQPSETKATSANAAAAPVRTASAAQEADTTDLGRVAVVGAGRLGTALVRGLKAVQMDVSGPHPRGFTGLADGRPDDVVVLCVPDDQITSAARRITMGPLVGHCSGASSLALLHPHRAFSIHPVMTFTRDAVPSVFNGVGAAVDGDDPAARLVATTLAERLGMRPFVVAAPDRIAYHAATSMAANFLVTLESAAGTMMRSAGADPALLVPLARAALDNWGRMGDAALTGPVARGDQATVDAQRQAVVERSPEHLALFEALTDATRRLAAGMDHDTRTHS